MSGNASLLLSTLHAAALLEERGYLYAAWVLSNEARAQASLLIGSGLL